MGSLLSHHRRSRRQKPSARPLSVLHAQNALLRTLRGGHWDHVDSGYSQAEIQEWLEGVVAGLPPACRGGYEYVRARPKGNPWVIWGPGDTEPRERVWNFEVEVEVGFASFGRSDDGSNSDGDGDGDGVGDGGGDGDGDGDGDDGNGGGDGDSDSDSEDDEWEQGDREWVRDLDTEVGEVGDGVESCWW